jgi:DNA modification methylase
MLQTSAIELSDRYKRGIKTTEEANVIQIKLASELNDELKKDTPASLTELNDSEAVLQKLSSLDWGFSEDNTTYLTHDIHPYPAKFIPQIPSNLMAYLSLPGEIVYDPFCGSGTTALEAILLGRRCICSDANPLSKIIGEAKTTALTKEQEEEIRSLSKKLKRPTGQKSLLDNCVVNYDFNCIKKEIPAIPYINKWFNPNAINELAYIKSLINGLSSEQVKNIAKVALSDTILRASNQDFETRYSCKPKKIPKGYTIEIFTKYLEEILKNVITLRQLLGFKTAKFITADLRKPIVKEGVIKENSIDLIVTSPPYPNATDYHLYHRFRLFWLGYDPREFAKIEIGSHLRHQKEGTGFEKYLEEMKLCLQNMFMGLRPGRYAAIILGDAIFKGQLFHTAEEVSKIAEEIGFKKIGIIERAIHKTKRSFINSARRASSEKILLLRKPPKTIALTLTEPPYKLWLYEKELREIEIKNILGTKIDKGENGSWNIQVDCMQVDKLKRLTFTKKFESQDFYPEQTWQSILENGSTTNHEKSTRKEPKYVTHGIHQYKGKFYPQLVKALLNIANIEPNSNILDPFCGSGTVLLEGYLNGFHAFGCDLNPLAVEVTRSKLDILSVNFNDFNNIINEFLSRMEKSPVSTGALYFPEECRNEIGNWFPKPVINKMGWLLTEIDNVSEPIIKRFLRVLVSDIIRQVSQQEPTDLRTRRRKIAIDDAPVFELFDKKLKEQKTKILRFAELTQQSPYSFHSPNIWLGDSTNVYNFMNNGLQKESIDAVITSPPYATALPYIDTDRLSLLLLSGMASKSRSQIEEELTGSRELSKKSKHLLENKITNADFEFITSHTATQTIKTIYGSNINSAVGFRRKNMAALLYRYFNNMSMVFNNLNEIVKKNGSIFIVIGDNYTIAGDGKIEIETTQILEETGKNVGWKLIDHIPITVTTENFKHIKNAITENTVLWFKK